MDIRKPKVLVLDFGNAYNFIASMRDTHSVEVVTLASALSNVKADGLTKFSTMVLENTRINDSGMLYHINEEYLEHIPPKGRSNKQHNLILSLNKKRRF